MEVTGIIRKMRTEMVVPVNYFLPIDDQEVAMNELIGKPLRMVYLEEINCIRCGRKTSKSFAQGYCFPCFRSAPETEECVLRPEQCQAHEGIARDMAYAEKNCLVEQVVYLSLTSGIKVGVTRGHQVPTRWIDQGALEAIELARAPNRYTAGLIEVFLKGHMNDKTNWRNMLKNIVPPDVVLPEVKQRVAALLPDDLSGFVSENDMVTEIEYPVDQYPGKIRSLNFDKDEVVEGTLSGIKGQYLIFDDSSVINIRKFGGYRVTFSY